MSRERIATQETSSLDKMVAQYARVGSANRAALSLGGFLLLFVTSRLLYLTLIDPNYLHFFSPEELYRGTIAQELVTGPKLPFTDYRADNYSGGSLVMGVLVAGFFLLFGPTVFALKLAPLFLFTLALAFWYQTLHQYASERLAGYFAVMFCFSPPLFTAYSVTAMGFHSESIFFTALTVLLLFRMLSDEGGSSAVPALLGLTAGFGLWFCYTYGLTLLAMLGFWFWHDTGRFRRTRVLWFALGFGAGFAPWIIINVQTQFAGLVIYGTNVWEHFGLMYLLDRLVHPRQLAPVEFLATIASNDDWDLYRRAANLLYTLLFLGPILTAAVLRLKRWRSPPAGPRQTRHTFVAFASLYVVLFALAVQFSDLRGIQYHLPAYPFLFFFVALSVALCEDLFPRVQRQIHTVFLTSVILLGLGTHAPLFSLGGPGEALSAKGYSYGFLPGYYVFTHAPAGPGDRKFIIEVVQRPFLSDILPKLSSDDQQELSRAIALLLAAAVPFNGQAEDFARIEQLVPPGFERHFYFQVGVMAMDRHPNDLPKAVAAVEFVRHRSAGAHHLALVGIYRSWPLAADMDRTPDSLINAAAVVAAEWSPHYWRAIGHWVGRYWYDKDRSLSLLNARLQVFVPRLDPSVQRYVLQGVGELLFTRLIDTPWVAPVELERFPHVYQPSLLEGWGMQFGEYDQFSEFPWHGPESPLWMASTKGLSARSLVSVQQGKAEFDVLFEGRASSALEVPRDAR